MAELKPCPFCGGNGDVTMLVMGAVIRVHVVCQKCGATGKMRRTAEDAVLNWNMRVEKEKENERT